MTHESWRTKRRHERSDDTQHAKEQYKWQETEMQSYCTYHQYEEKNIGKIETEELKNDFIVKKEKNEDKNHACSHIYVFWLCGISEYVER